MAKSKNHTGHNQNYKNHRNGIKKARRSKKMKIDGSMNCKFVRNMKAVNKGMECSAAEKEERKQAQREAQKALEGKRKEEEEARRALLLEERARSPTKQKKEDATMAISSGGVGSG
eukprot:CAMPEP_0172853880 /NCGR_PEP_ID=MMETSP1075-20121228/57414_1 /TAXON_ID=2916 /ORGANISM="Ceratium fusus, Strain PA161109" /LENGTH=115 /DNA_ID=CAMNT_0013700453 /DNA_START=91 /DNA_END=435 /DNA_ORIENTATION=-